MKKIILATVAVVMTVGIFAFGRKTDSESNSAKAWATYQFRFKSQDLNDAMTPSQFELITGTPPACEGLEQLPCVIQVTSNLPASQALEDYLESFDNVEEVKEAAISRRAIQ